MNHAIRKYGKDNFKVETLCECLIEELNDEETKYVEQYDTTNPKKGYNLKKGGGQASFTEESNKRRSEARKGIPKKEEHIRKSQLNQIGNRRNTKSRKNIEDANLPKYINAIRRNNTVVGYGICRYPIGVTEKQYISKSFYNQFDPKSALEDAIEYLKELVHEYEEKVQKAIKERKEKETLGAVIARTVSKKPADLIHPIPHPDNPNKFQGYVVKGLVDNNNNPIPEKEFKDVTNRWNLHRAKKYIDQVQNLLKNKVDIKDWTNVDTIYKSDKKGVETENLPKYINICRYKGQKSGYVVNGYPLPNGKKSCKKFTNTFRNTLEQLYEQALDYLNSLKQQYPIK